MTNDSVVASSVAPAAPSDSRANVQDVLPLLPNQLALLLYRERAEVDPGFLQVRYRLEGPLDVGRYQQAWRAVVDRHPTLRTSIRHREDGNPLAIVWRSVSLDVHLEDWRLEEDQGSRMERLLQSDRKRGLDLTAAPAMRLQLVRTQDEVHEAVWTCHHLYVDGWSSAIVLEDVMEFYRRTPAASPPPPPPPSDGLRSYVAWFSRRDEHRLRQYWSGALAGYGGTPPLRIGTIGGASGSGELTVEITDEMAERIGSLASGLGVPTAVVFQAAWALALSLLTGQEDLAFGTTVSGRNAEVTGMERLVGYFSNAVPVRVHIDRSADLAEWLRGFRDRQFEMAGFEHASLADIHRWSDVPGHRAIFDTFVVVENFLAGESKADGVVQSDFRSGLTTAYPITLAVGMASPWFLQLQNDRRSCSDEGAKALVDQLLRLLDAVIDDPAQSVGAAMDAAGNVLSGLVSPTDENGRGRFRPGRAGRTDTERRLTAIWCRHLDLAEVGIDDNYFDLGGTSLGAVGLFASIKDEFEIDLPLSTLLTHPTVERLAGVISGEEPGATMDSECLVPIQPEGTRAPIAGVHGGGGEVYIYRELAGLLGAEQPVFGLQPVGIDGTKQPLESVPEMAARYVEELRQVQPEGPYRLMGFCFGGSVCLEMAAQLEDMGHEVDFIGVIDGGLPIDQARFDTVLERVRYLVHTRGWGGTARAAGRRLRWRSEQLWRTLRRRFKGKASSRHVAVALANDRAFNAFQPRSSSAPITLIRSAEQQVGEGRDWDFSWEGYTPRLEIETVDAGHTTLFEGPAAAKLADIIRRSIPD